MVKSAFVSLYLFLLRQSKAAYSGSSFFRCGISQVLSMVDGEISCASRYATCATVTVLGLEILRQKRPHIFSCLVPFGAFMDS